MTAGNKRIGAALERRRSRMTLDLPLSLEEALVGVADANAETKADVIRRAIRFYLKCETFRVQGYDAGVFRTNEDGEAADIRAVIAL